MFDGFTRVLMPVVDQQLLIECRSARGPYKLITIVLLVWWFILMQMSAGAFHIGNTIIAQECYIFG